MANEDLDITNRFLSLKIKKQSYEGKAANVIFLNDVTKKIR